MKISKRDCKCWLNTVITEISEIVDNIEETFDVELLESSTKLSIEEELILKIYDKLYQMNEVHNMHY